MTYLPNGNTALKAKVPYKISAISGGYVANYGLSGNIIYGYIEFYSTGSITFQKSTTVNALIVGGGGGGGGASTGGYNGSNSSAFGSVAYGGGGGSNNYGTYINSAATIGSGGGITGSAANRSVPTAGQGNYGGYNTTSGSGPWGYGGWTAWGAGGSYNNSPANVSATWTTYYDNSNHSGPTIAGSIGGDSSVFNSYDPINLILFSTAGYITKYKIENKGLLSDPSWDSSTAVTNSQVGTIFSSTTNLYSSYNRVPAYVSVVRSYAGGGGAPSGGSWTSGNTGGYGSGGDSGHSTWGDSTIGGGSGWGGTGGGGAGGLTGGTGGGGGGGGGVLSITATAAAGTAYPIVVGAGGSGGTNPAGGSGGSGIVIVKYMLIDMSSI